MKLKALFDSAPAMWLAALSVACQSPMAAEDAPTACRAGTQVPCTCPDGTSSLVACAADGSQFGRCECPLVSGSGGSVASLPSIGSGGSWSGAPSSVATGGNPSGAGGAYSQGGAYTQVGVSGGGPGGGTAGAAPAASDLPCAVRDIVATSCGTCHSGNPMFGAPMSLMTAADFRAHGSAVLRRVADDVHPMPPEPYARLTAAEESALQAFIEAGAPSGSCSTPLPPTGEMPNTGPTGSTDPNVTCYRMTARDSASAASYTVPTTPDLYQCFMYAPPWGNKKVQVVSTKPIVDNAKVLHHYILYNNTGSVKDGTNSGCLGAHPDATMVTGWAPGGQPMVLPDDVGLGVLSGGFTLELHYNNKVGTGQTDASGVEVCVTEKPRANEAAIHWLGTQSLNKITTSGTCTPSAKSDVTVLSSTPHMHLQGRHLKTVINRADGKSEILLDKSFDFNTQVSYPTKTVIKPGDTLTTTCTFAQPTPFGEGTNQEMCYNFVLAYPAGGLAQTLQLLRKNDCTGF